jgi:hypothetical protein
MPATAQDGHDGLSGTGHHSLRDLHHTSFGPALDDPLTSSEQA